MVRACTQVTKMLNPAKPLIYAHGAREIKKTTAEPVDWPMLVHTLGSFVDLVAGGEVFSVMPAPTMTAGLTRSVSLSPHVSTPANSQPASSDASSTMFFFVFERTRRCLFSPAV